MLKDCIWKEWREEEDESALTVVPILQAELGNDMWQIIMTV